MKRTIPERIVSHESKTNKQKLWNSWKKSRSCSEGKGSVRRWHFERLGHRSTFRNVSGPTGCVRRFLCCRDCDSGSWSFKIPTQRDTSLLLLLILITSNLWFHAVNRLASAPDFQDKIWGDPHIFQGILLTQDRTHVSCVSCIGRWILHHYATWEALIYYACKAGDPGFDSWVGRISWRRKWQSTPALLPGKSHGQRSLIGYSPWGRKESDMTELLATSY